MTRYDLSVILGLVAVAVWLYSLLMPTHYHDEKQDQFLVRLLSLAFLGAGVIVALNGTRL